MNRMQVSAVAEVMTGLHTKGMPGVSPFPVFVSGTEKLWIRSKLLD